MHRLFSIKEINLKDVSNKELDTDKDEMLYDDSGYREENDILPFAGEVVCIYIYISLHRCIYSHHHHNYHHHLHYNHHHYHHHHGCREDNDILPFAGELVYLHVYIYSSMCIYMSIYTVVCVSTCLYIQ
jgi:hypothetical protein